MSETEREYNTFCKCGHTLGCHLYTKNKVCSKSNCYCKEFKSKELLKEVQGDKE